MHRKFARQIRQGIHCAQLDSSALQCKAAGYVVPQDVRFITALCEPSPLVMRAYFRTREHRIASLRSGRRDAPHHP